MGVKGYTNFDFEYRRKCTERQSEIAHELTFNSESLTRDQKDALMLEYMMLSIRPYSPWWREGMVSVLKRAIKRTKAQG